MLKTSTNIIFSEFFEDFLKIFSQTLSPEDSTEALIIQKIKKLKKHCQRCVDLHTHTHKNAVKNYVTQDSKTTVIKYWKKRERSCVLALDHKICRRTQLHADTDT